MLPTLKEINNKKMMGCERVRVVHVIKTLYNTRDLPAFLHRYNNAVGSLWGELKYVLVPL